MRILLRLLPRQQFPLGASFVIPLVIKTTDVVIKRLLIKSQITEASGGSSLNSVIESPLEGIISMGKGRSQPAGKMPRAARRGCVPGADRYIRKEAAKDPE